MPWRRFWSFFFVPFQLLRDEQHVFFFLGFLPFSMLLCRLGLGERMEKPEKFQGDHCGPGRHAGGSEECQSRRHRFHQCDRLHAQMDTNLGFPFKGILVIFPGVEWKWRLGFWGLGMVLVSTIHGLQSRQTSCCSSCDVANKTDKSNVAKI